MLIPTRTRFARVLGALLLTPLLLLAPAQAPANAAVAKPASVKAVSTSYKAIAMSWAAVPGAARYSVQYSTSSAMKKPKYWKTDKTYVEITGLSASKTYYLRVRVLDASNKAISSYSGKIKAKTKSKSSYPYLAPKELRAGSPAADLIPLTWGSRSSTAKYQVAYRISSSSTYKTVTVGSAKASVAGLTPAKTYYVKVRVLNSAGSVKSDYSPAIKVNTAKYTVSAPGGLGVSGAKPTQLTVDWNSVSGADAYRIQYSTSSSMSGAKTVKAAGTSHNVTALAAAKTYYFKVQALRSDGGAISGYSGAVSGKTGAATSASVRVASFNVGSAFASGPSWKSRVSTVVSTIKGQSPDVVGFQEASQGRLDPDVSYAQFDDLIDRLGSPYRLTNTHRYNCTNSITTKDCVKKDLGASGGTRIAYNSDVLDLESQGSKLLSKATSSAADRFTAWAIFQHKASGKRFFFTSVHLEPGSTTTIFNLRKKQTGEVVALIKAKNPDKLPTYVVGDFNSGKWAEPSNAPYDLMVQADYVDPLGNTYRSTQVAAAGIADSRVRANCDSFNGYKSKANCVSYAAANYLDYIWVSKGVKVPEWETVLKIDGNQNFVGTIPSDHNMLRATTTLS